MKYRTIKTAAVAAVAAAPFLSAVPSHATLTPVEQAMVDGVVTKLGDIAGAVGDLVTANIGVAVALLIGGIIYAFVKRAG